MFVIFNSCAISQEKESILSKSPYDLKNYSSFSLSNGLQVLLISDSKAAKSSASIAIGAGYYDDPSTSPGLSHLLEHLLFTGSESYEKPKDLKDFFKTNGGWISATTGAEYTNYYFEISNRELEPGLERLSDMIKNPLLSKKYISSEIKIVNSEFTSKLKDDWRRTQAVLKQSMNPSHPNSKFAGGNSLTLQNSNVEEELRKFHKEFYVANNMTLVIYSNKSIDDLKHIVDELFSDLVMKLTLQKPTMPTRYLDSQLGLNIKVKTFSKQETLDLRFPTTSRFMNANSNPAEYIAYLIGNKSKNTLYDKLKSSGLIRSLSTNFHGDTRQGIFNVYIRLTDTGAQDKDKIIEYFFEYINFLRSKEHPSWLMDDLRSIKRSEFYFPNIKQLGDYVAELSLSMHKYDKENWLAKGANVSSIKRNEVDQYIGFFKPDNMRVLHSSSQIATDKVEEHYGTSYAEERFSKEQVARWNNPKNNTTFSFPSKNVFLPTEYESLRKPADIELAFENAGIKLWSIIPTNNLEPKAALSLNVYDANVSKNITSIAKSRVFIEVLNERLRRYSYVTKQGGLNFDIYSHLRGYRVNIDGFQQKQPELLRAILTELIAKDISEDEYISSKKSLSKFYREDQYRKPFRQVQDAIYEEIYPKVYNKTAIANVIDKVKYDSFKRWLKENLRNVYIEGVSVGNRSKNEVGELGRIIGEIFNDRSDKNIFEAIDYVRVPKNFGLKRRLAIEHPDSSIAYFIQGEDDSHSTRAKFELAQYLLSPTMFNELRTEQNLGYVFHINTVNSQQTAGINIIMQSTEYSPKKLKIAIEKSFANFYEKLVSVDEKRFQDFKQRLISSSVQSLDNKTLASRLRKNIEFQVFDFSLEESRVTALQELSKEDFEVFFKRTFVDKMKNSIIIWSLGKFEEKISKCECQVSKCTVAQICTN